MKNALIVIAPGSEEIETVSVIDILSRGGVNVVIGALNHEYDLDINCAHGTVLQADALLKDLCDTKFDVIIVPGGLQGAMNCRDSLLLGKMLRQQLINQDIIAAICAAPGLVLTAHGILDENTPATGYPGTTKAIPCFVNEGVVVDAAHNIITAKGPAYAADFGFTILRCLVGDEIANKVSEDMLY